MFFITYSCRLESAVTQSAWRAGVSRAACEAPVGIEPRSLAVMLKGEGSLCVNARVKGVNSHSSHPYSACVHSQWGEAKAATKRKQLPLSWIPLCSVTDTASDWFCVLSVQHVSRFFAKRTLRQDPAQRAAPHQQKQFREGTTVNQLVNYSTKRHQGHEVTSVVLRCAVLQTARCSFPRGWILMTDLIRSDGQVRRTDSKSKPTVH